MGLRQNRRRKGRAPTGLAALHIVTLDQDGRPVLDFSRCALLPLRRDVDTGHDDDLDSVGSDRRAADPRRSVTDWDLAAWRPRPGPAALPHEGQRIEVVGGDEVSSAPELARLTLNVARMHLDEDAGDGRRLVYGGHAIGLALSQATRALPGLATVLGWNSCDHSGPVHEGRHAAQRDRRGAGRAGPRGSGGGPLRSRVRSGSGEVLDWRFLGLFPTG